MEVCVHFLTCFSYSNAQILYCCYSQKLNFYLYYTRGLPPHRNIYARNNPQSMYSVSHTKYSFRSPSSFSWNKNFQLSCKQGSLQHSQDSTTGLTCTSGIWSTLPCSIYDLIVSFHLQPGLP
jgi:hypothetical protein